MTFESGQIFAHFKIIRKLGEGGMGEVYLVEDQKLGREVALKILQPEFFDNKERLDRFNREARTAAKVSHANVMAIYDFGKAVEENSGATLSYIVMELVKGESLTKYLSNKQPDIKELMRLASRIAAGLAAAHKLGIVHRDIKTDNIIVDENGEPKILDFGLAKPAVGALAGMEDDSTQTVAPALTTEGKILGTVTYMSPEQARGEQVDTRSDIFSFGIMAYKMFTGEFPFSGSDPVSTIAKILESRQEPLRLKNEELPPELDRIIDKCLQKDPDDRYQDTRDLVVDLRNLRRQYESGISDTSALSTGYVPPKRKQQKSFLAWLTWPKLVFLGILSIPLLAIFMNIFNNDHPKITQVASESGLVAPAGDGALAILGFSNKTGDKELDWLTAGLPEILLTDLGQNSEMKIISRTRVLDCLEDKVTGNDDMPGHKECIDAAKSLGATTVLSGSFYKLGDKLRIDARLEDIGSGRIILGEKVVGADPFVLVDSLTEKIGHSLRRRNAEAEARRLTRGKGRLAGGTKALVDSILASVNKSLRDAGVPGIDRGVAEITSSSVDAYKHYMLGMEKFQLHLHDQAREQFARAIEIDSTFALPYMRIAMSYAFEGRQQEAVPYLRDALRFQDKLPAKERALLDVYADTWFHQDYDAAFSKLEAYVHQYPDDKEARTIYALYLQQLIGNIPAAQAQLDTALSIDSRFALALEASAQILERQKKWEEAIDYWKRIKRYYPESPAAYWALMRIYLRLNWLDDVIRESTDLLKISPNDDEAFLKLVTVYVLKRDFVTAGEYAEKIKEHYGDDPRRMVGYYLILANLAAWEGRFYTAMDNQFAALEKAKESGDSSSIASRYSYIANQYIIFEKPDSTLYYAKLFDQWATMFQKISYPLTMVMIDHSQAPVARGVFKEIADEIKARFPKEFWGTINALEEMFDGYCNADTAMIIAGRRKQLDRPGQENVGSIAELGRFLVLAGQYEEGKKTLQRVISGERETTSAIRYIRSLYHIGLAEEALGNIQAAIDKYREVLRYWGNPDFEFKEIRSTREHLARLVS